MVTEAVHVLGMPRDQDSVLDMLERGSLRILPLDAGDIPRVLDKDFRVYRIGRNHSFTVAP